MSERRPVRVDPRFLEQLDAQLAEERGPNAIVADRLPSLRAPGEIVESEGEVVLDRPEVISGRPDYRQVITTGRLVPVIAIVGQLTPDESVLLLGIDLTWTHTGRR